MQVGALVPVTFTVAPGPAIPIDSPGRMPTVSTCAPGPTAMAAGPDRNCDDDVAVPPFIAIASDRLVVAASASALPPKP